MVILVCFFASRQTFTERLNHLWQYVSTLHMSLLYLKYMGWEVFFEPLVLVGKRNRRLWMYLYLYKPGLLYALDSIHKTLLHKKMFNQIQTCWVNLKSAGVGEPFVLTQQLKVWLTMLMCELTIDRSQVTVLTRGNWIPVGFWGHSLHCPRWRWSRGTLSTCDWSPTLSPMTSCPIPSGVSAPFPADLFQNVSFSPRLCCLFCRSLSLCCERLRLLVLEVNLTNLWIFLLLPLVLFSSLFLLHVMLSLLLASKLDIFSQRLFFFF